MISRRIHLLVIPLVVLSSGALAGQPQDACLAKIPTSLASALHTKYSEFRLPIVKDGEPTQVQWSREHGHGDCVLVATGDFDGNGLADVAVLLSSKQTKKVILVSALSRCSEWSIYELPTWCDSISSCYVDTSAPGKYEMTESFDYTTQSPKSRERLASRNQVIVSGTPESTGIVHAYIGGQWLYVWVSD